MMSGFLPALPFALCAYAAGCFSPGYYLFRWRRGGDIRARHSGSTGARNAGRELGRAGFAAVFLCDALKGAGVIGIARAFGLPPAWIPALAPCVVAGHIWPAQLGFRGGKGLVTALGAMIGLDWRFLPAGLLLYFAPSALAVGTGGAEPPDGGHAPAAGSRTASPGAGRRRAATLLSGALPMAVMPFLPFPRWSPAQIVPLAVACAMVLWAHRSHAVPNVTPE
jgi:hypothetical protein